RGGAVVSSACRRRVETSATSSIAAMNAASFALEGFLKPLIFLTNCTDAARTSSGVTGGSKLKSVLIFLHILIGYREGGRDHRPEAIGHRKSKSEGTEAPSQVNRE